MTHWGGGGRGMSMLWNKRRPLECKEENDRDTGIMGGAWRKLENKNNIHTSVQWPAREDNRLTFLKKLGKEARKREKSKCPTVGWKEHGIFGEQGDAKLQLGFLKMNCGRNGWKSIWDQIMEEIMDGKGLDWKRLRGSEWDQRRDFLEQKLWLSETEE